MIKKNILRAAILINAILLSACHQSETKKEHADTTSTSIQPVKTFFPGEITNHTTAEGNSYAFYTPKNFSPDKKYSALLFLDPHGKGNLPLKLYRNLADKFGVILLGSNDSKNGISIETEIAYVKGLLNECKRLPASNGKISLVGFSGGAKVALISGGSVPGFTTIIYCGAALPVENIVSTVPTLGFAGKKDMNYTEVRNYSRVSKSVLKECGIVEWNGKHEWPDSAAFQRAFYWHLLNIEKDSILIRNYKNFIETSVMKEDNPLRKVDYLANYIALTERYIPVQDVKKNIGRIMLSPEYANAKETERKILAAEDLKKQEFINSFSNQDLSWWKKQIEILTSNKNESNQRLLGYISLASWSYSSKAVESNDVSFAKKVLAIYELADPENSEHQFLKACLQAKNNNPDSAIYFLKEAVNLGMDDRSKVENEKYFVQLRGRNDYVELVSQLKY